MLVHRGRYVCNARATVLKLTSVLVHGALDITSRSDLQLPRWRDLSATAIWSQGGALLHPSFCIVARVLERGAAALEARLVRTSHDGDPTAGAGHA